VTIIDFFVIANITQIPELKKSWDKNVKKKF
jgi:hypothetical protein